MDKTHESNTQAEMVFETEAERYGHRLRESFGPELDYLITYPDNYGGMYLDGETLEVYTTNEGQAYVEDLQARAGSQDIRIIKVQFSLNELYRAMDHVNELFLAGGYGGLIHSAGIFPQENNITIYVNDNSEGQIDSLRQRLPDFGGFKFEQAPETPEPSQKAEDGRWIYNHRIGYWATNYEANGAAAYGIVANKNAMVQGTNFGVKQTAVFGQSYFVSQNTLSNAGFAYFINPIDYTPVAQFDGFSGRQDNSAATPIIGAWVGWIYGTGRVVSGKVLSASYSATVDGDFLTQQYLAEYPSDPGIGGGIIVSSSESGTVPAYGSVYGMHAGAVSASRSIYTPYNLISKSLSLSGDAHQIFPSVPV